MSLKKLHSHLADQLVHTLRDIFVDKRHADKSIEYAFKQHRKWGARDRRFFAETIYDIVRWWRQYWYVAGLSDEIYLRPIRIADVHLEAVIAANSVKKNWSEMCQAYAPYSRLPFEEMAQRLKKINEQSSGIRHGFPDWLDQRFEKAMGAAKWQALAEIMNEQAPLFLRVNTLKAELEQVRKELTEADHLCDDVKGSPDALQMREKQPLFALPAFKEGRFEIQDLNSQKIAPMLQVEPGLRVVDACAGGGGKTLHLAALMQNKGRILAMDIHEWKLEELRKRARRAGVSVIETRLIEGSKTIKRLAGQMDRVLLDVPCTGLGVLRRNPDTKWKLTEEELERLLVTQQELLSRYSSMIKVGGKLVYATCSLLPEENEKQVAQFLNSESGTNWQLEEQITMLPTPKGGDGFYAARLIKNS
jgi:16S rRNA (cytosine967-C5)-methyltransferase